MNTPLSIDDRVNLSLVFNRCLRSQERFEAASADYSEACQAVRSVLGPNRRFVARHDHKMFLVTSDNESNFTFEEIESL